MRDAFQLRRAAAIVGCAASIAGASVAFTPGVAAARAGKSCGSRSIPVKSGGKQLTFPVSRIRVEGGATCAEAVKVIRGVVLHKIPKGWSVGSGGYKVPRGLTGHVAVKGHKKVEFALPGR